MRSDQDASAACRSERSAVAISRNTHDLVNDHFGTAEAEQIASGTPTSGYIPVAAGAGNPAAWTAMPDSGGLLDLLTGNDADFTTTVGNWTSSSGAVTRDTTYKITGTTASLKWVAPSSGTDYVECPIAGTFEAGVTYAALVYLSIEETTGSARDIRVTLGVPGTDSTFNSVSLTAVTSYPGVGNGNFYSAVVFWTPTADRTTVKLRLALVTATATTIHAGAARAWETPTVGVHKVGSQLPAYPADNGDLHLSPWGNGSGVVLGTDGRVVMENVTAAAGFLMSRPDDAYAYIWAEHTPGDLSYEGIEFDVGADYLALYGSEKDAGTYQLYGYDDQDFELRDLGTGHWMVTNPGDTLSKNLIEMEQRKGSGTATITSTNTSVSVTHGAGYTPATSDLTVTPTNSPTNDPGWFWISNVGATTFDINVRSDPGASGATFAWRVDR